MKCSQNLTSTELFQIAEYIDNRYSNFIFFYSGLYNKDFSGRYSIIAFDVKESISGSELSLLNGKLKGDSWLDSWFGYIGYEMKNTIEPIFTEDQDSFITLPNLYFAQYNNIIMHDRLSGTMQLFGSVANQIVTSGVYKKIKFKTNKAGISYHKHNMTKEQYIGKVNEILELIKQGRVFQVNLTYKLYGEFIKNVNKLSIFRRICRKSPAFYSSFIKIDQDTAIISLSPERFLKLEENGTIKTRPIKGTISRSRNKEQDKINKKILQNSQKDMAENLMIVDLMRNDLSKFCEINSIRVSNLFKITAYKAIYHMSSDIFGIKQKNIDSIDIIRNCFPAGSMTGAPKIEAMKICSQMEKQKRGVYSGIIGYFKGSSELDFAVVIRTIITLGDKFELQVGGGIVADSKPELEWQESIAKVKTIMDVLF